jgi:hypothetical protein
MGDLSAVLWALCSHGKLNYILTRKNWVTFPKKNWSLKESRPSFIARPITESEECVEDFTLDNEMGGRTGFKIQTREKIEFRERENRKKGSLKETMNHNIISKISLMCAFECRYILYEIQNK